MGEVLLTIRVFPALCFVAIRSIYNKKKSTPSEYDWVEPKITMDNLLLSHSLVLLYSSQILVLNSRIWKKARETHPFLSISLSGHS